MTIVHTRSTYALSMLIAQIVVFGSLSLLQILFGSSGMLGIAVFLYAMIYGVFIIGVAALIGFPVFKKISSHLNYSYFLNVFVSGLCSAVIVGLAFSLFWQLYTYQFLSQIMGLKDILIVSTPILAMSVPSCIFYWLLTKNINNKFKNESASKAGPDASSTRPF